MKKENNELFKIAGLEKDAFNKFWIETLEKNVELCEKMSHLSVVNAERSKIMLQIFKAEMEIDQS